MKEGEAEQETVTETIDMKTSLKRREKKTQVEEEEELEEIIAMKETTMKEIIMIEMTDTTGMMKPMKGMIDKTEEKREMITTEMTEIAEMKEDMTEVEDMEMEAAVGVADQETALEDTARRVEAKESLL